MLQYDFILAGRLGNPSCVDRRCILEHGENWLFVQRIINTGLNYANYPWSYVIQWTTSLNSSHRCSPWITMPLHELDWPRRWKMTFDNVVGCPPVWESEQRHQFLTKLSADVTAIKVYVQRHDHETRFQRSWEINPNADHQLENGMHVYFLATNLNLLSPIQYPTLS